TGTIAFTLIPSNVSGTGRCVRGFPHPITTVFSTFLSPPRLPHRSMISIRDKAEGDVADERFKIVYYYVYCIMPVKNTIPYTQGIFSITITCYKWLLLIEKVNGYEIVYKWFDYLLPSNVSGTGRCVSWFPHPITTALPT